MSSACLVSTIIGAALGDIALPVINVKLPATASLFQDPVEEAYGHLRPCTTDTATNCSSSDSELLFVDGKDAHKHRDIIARRLSTRGRSLGVLFKDFSPAVAEALPSNFPVQPNSDSQYIFIQPLYHPTRGDTGFGLLQRGIGGPVPTSMAYDESGNQYIVNGTDLRDNSLRQFAAEVEKHRVCDTDMSECWSLYGADPNSGMIPSEAGACYSYVHFKPQKSFSDVDSDSYTNVFWYTYAKANPSTKQLEGIYIYTVASGIHTTSPSVPWGDNNGLAVGWYKAEETVKLQLSPTTGDASGLGWVESGPATQNTVHTEGSSESNTNSHEKSFNLGYDGEKDAVSGSFSFSSVKSHETSYSVTTDITDWSVVEQSDAVKGFGQWKYYESWPTNVVNYPGSNFANNFEQWYSTSATSNSELSAKNSATSGCQVKNPPVLSTNSQHTSSGIGWLADKNLIDVNGNMFMTLDFSMSMTFHRVWCPLCCDTSDCNPCGDIGTCSNPSVYRWGSSHHCLQTQSHSYPGSWNINALNMANLVKSSEAAVV